MKDRFAGKTAIVTGGASGIGAAVASRFAEEGGSVVIADMSASGEALAERLLRNGHEAAFIRTDVSSAQDTLAMAVLAEERFGGVDLLANCAGIFPRGTLMETTEALWDSIMNVNAKGVFLACQAAVPALIRRGGGAIVNIGSLNGYCGGSNLFAYSASKGALWTMTRNLAVSLAEHRIRVNCVTPGWVASGGELAMQKSLGQPDDWVETMGKRAPLGRLQTPDDIAAAVLFLASDDAAQITGQDLGVDGGMKLRFK